MNYFRSGLPHIHLLVWLAEPLRLEEVDEIISAEIPCKETDPLLYEIVTKHMIHGPCGNMNPGCVCMENGKCSKNFPKPFCSETQSDGDGYPKYK